MMRWDGTIPPLPADATAQVELTPEGAQITLQPLDAHRRASGLLLVPCLVVWAAVELLAIGWGLLEWTAPAAGGGLPRFDGFALGWLTLWSVGGMIPAYALLRIFWGIDRFTIGLESCTIWHGVGRWGWGRRLDVREVCQVTLHRGTTALVAQVGGKRRTLTSLGTGADRRWLRDLLRGVTGEIPSAPVPALASGSVRLQRSASPPGYWVRQLPDGSTCLGASAGRRMGEIGCGLIFTLLWNAIVSVFLLDGLHLLPSEGETPSKGPMSPGGWGYWLFLMPFLLIGLGFIVALYRVAFESEQWRVSANSIEIRNASLGWRRVSRYSDATLRLSVSIDSDGDESWRLLLVVPAASRELDSGNPATLRTLGLFLANLTGWALCEPEDS